MKTLQERNYQKLIGLLPALPTMQVGAAVALRSDSFMDLHIDVLSRSDDQMTIAMAHYYSMNGDQVPDPDMEVAVLLKEQRVAGLTYQNILVFTRRSEGWDSSVSLDYFLSEWLTNLKDQGHQLQ